MGDRDRDREKDKKYGGSKRSRDLFEKHKDENDKKKVSEPPLKKLRRISRSGNSSDDKLKNKNQETMSNATTRKLRRIVRKPNESESSDNNQMIETVQVTKTEKSRKRKIVLNAVDNESEKKKIADIIKETESKRMRRKEEDIKKKEKKKMIEIDLKRLEAEKAKVAAALSLPKMPSILISETPKNPIKSVKVSKDKKKEKERARQKEKERQIKEQKAKKQRELFK